MKRARFTEDQIIGVLKGTRPGLRRRIWCASTGLGSDALQLEGQVRWHGCLRGHTAEAARGRESRTEEAFGRADVGCRRASRASVKKKVGPAVKRVSWLFCGSDRGGRRAADMYSLIVTAKMNGVDPQAWLADVLSRIAANAACRQSLRNMRSSAQPRPYVDGPLASSFFGDVSLAIAVICPACRCEAEARWP